MQNQLNVEVSQLTHETAKPNQSQTCRAHLYFKTFVSSAGSATPRLASLSQEKLWVLPSAFIPSPWVSLPGLTSRGAQERNAVLSCFISFLDLSMAFGKHHGGKWEFIAARTGVALSDSS